MGNPRGIHARRFITTCLVDVLDSTIKLEISTELGIPKGLNTNGALLSTVVYEVKGLRNAVAHNKVIYDGRYMDFKKRESLKTMLSQSTGISNISFASPFDDIVLICFLLKNLGFRKDEIRRIHTGISKALSTLKQKLPNELFQKTTAGFNNRKFCELKAYISKKS